MRYTLEKKKTLSALEKKMLEKGYRAHTEFIKAVKDKTGFVISATHVSHICTGRIADPKCGTMLILAHVLECKIEEILDFDVYGALPSLRSFEAERKKGKKE